MKFSEMNYERINLESVRAQAKVIIDEFDAADTGEGQFKIHKKYYTLKDEVTTTIRIAKIRHDIDTSNVFYNEENDYYDEILPELQNIEQMYLRKVYASPYRGYLGYENYLELGYNRLNRNCYRKEEVEAFRAQICAFQYKIWMDKDYKEAWDSYLKLCQLSASDYFVNLLEKVGLENPFEDGVVEKIVRKLQ